MPIKSFRGKLAGDGTETIPLHTNNGSQGYRIKKLEVVPASFGSDQIGIFTVNTIPFTPVTTVDFSDQTLVGVAIVRNDNSQGGTASDQVIVFDNLTFNQDIYLTHVEQSTNGVNFYLELEQAKLSKDEATVATLKDMRAGPDTNFGP